MTRQYKETDLGIMHAFDLVRKAQVNTFYPPEKLASDAGIPVSHARRVERELVGEGRIHMVRGYGPRVVDPDSHEYIHPDVALNMFVARSLIPGTVVTAYELGNRLTHTGSVRAKQALVRLGRLGEVKTKKGVGATVLEYPIVGKPSAQSSAGGIPQSSQKK